MADANTSLFGFVKPEVGASADTWGGKLNADMDDIDAFLGAFVLTGSSSAYVLTTGASITPAAKFRALVQWNHTNASTSPTLNIDGAGATAIKKRDGSTSPSASDLVSGRWNHIVFDGTNIVVVDLLPSDFQPLDATLTALAALSWSSGNALVQFTAADTVSLTLTPSVSSVTASQGAANTTPSGTFVNTTDNASVRALRIEGDRATPANNDIVYASFYLSSGAGTQRESGRISSQLWDVTNGAEYGAMLFGAISNGTLTNLAYLNPFEFSPNTSDGLQLGSASRMWSDLFLASGGVINWNNGNFTLTHVTGGVEASGFIEARVPRSSETSGTLTVASANRKVACSGGITLDDGVFTADDFILFDAGTSARTFTRASGLTMYVNGTDSASATLAANQMGTAHWRSSTVVVLSGAFS